MTSRCQGLFPPHPFLREKPWGRGCYHIAYSWYSKHNKRGSPYSVITGPDAYVYNFVFTDLMNKCYSSPCENGGTCVGDYKDYTCTCTKDWLGRNCEIARKLFFPDCLKGLFYHIIYYFINKTAVEK